VNRVDGEVKNDGQLGFGEVALNQCQAFCNFDIERIQRVQVHTTRQQSTDRLADAQKNV
jgi:hypothetical protein